MENKDVIERVPFSNDRTMYEKCKLLQKICTQSRDEQIGRGKKATIIKVQKYTIDKKVLDKINRSVEFYKNLMKENTTI